MFKNFDDMQALGTGMDAALKSYQAMARRSCSTDAGTPANV
jgi:hypothetical protein